MVAKFRMRCTGTQLIDSLVHCARNDHECNVPENYNQASAGTSDPLQHRPPVPKLDILAFDADEEPHGEWEAEDDVNGGPLDPREVKNARKKEIKYLWCMEVYEYSTDAVRTQPS